jgi:hypothetical protein
VKRSAALVVLVPAGVVTVMSIGPRAPAGLVTESWVSVKELNLGAGVTPKWTAVTPVKPLPKSWTNVPPPVAPWLGLTEFTTGNPGALYVNLSEALTELVPPGVVTLTSVIPAVPAGLATLIWLSAVVPPKIVATLAPKWTLDVPVNPDPKMETKVWPAVDPWLGEMP